MWRIADSTSVPPRPQLQLTQPLAPVDSEHQPLRPLTPNRSDTGGLPFNRRIRTAWISFLERDRESRLTMVESCRRLSQALASFQRKTNSGLELWPFSRLRSSSSWY